MQRRNVLLSIASAFVTASVPLLPAPAKAQKLLQNGISGAHTAIQAGDTMASYWFKTDVEPNWRKVVIVDRGEVVNGYLDGFQWPAESVQNDACFALLVNLARSVTDRFTDPHNQRALQVFYDGLYARLGSMHLREITVTKGWIEA